MVWSCSLFSLQRPVVSWNQPAATQNVLRGLAEEEKKTKKNNKPSAVQGAEQIKGNLSVRKKLYLSISVLKEASHRCLN